MTKKQPTYQEMRGLAVNIRSAASNEIDILRAEMIENFLETQQAYTDMLIAFIGKFADLLAQITTEKR